MKSFTHILLAVLMLGGHGALMAAPLSGTKGSNLTAYNPSMGVINNNEWNAAINGRGSSGTAATADFGNCNSLILRCASPKCANGGCTSIDIATPIVSGCVASNAACKQYGDELVQYIAAQLVANSTAKTNAQMAAAQTAAAEASAQQMQEMQAQMQEMQQQIAAQNAEQIAQLQSALEEQQRATEEALAQAAAPAAVAENTTVTQPDPGAANTTTASSGTTPTTVMEGLTEAQRIAASAGVSADILAREQIAGQILTYVENAKTNMDRAYAAMQDAFTYAGCTKSGDNCTGPKRVSVFRQKALAFFEPYDSALDELYNALELAQTVGADISDIYMMLNGSCNTWGEFLCNGGKKEYDGKLQWARYDDKSCPKNGGKSVGYEFSRGQNNECYQGGTIPPEDSTACTMNRALADMEEVQRNFLFADTGDLGENVRVGCMSSVLQNSRFFRNRRNSANSLIDVETLQRIISQDAPAYAGSNKYQTATGNANGNKLKYCALTPNGYMNLENAVATKKLPARICVRDGTLTDTWESQGSISVSTSEKLLGRSNTGATVSGYNEYACKQMGCTWINGACTIPITMALNNDGFCEERAKVLSDSIFKASGINSFGTSTLIMYNPAVSSKTNNIADSYCTSRHGIPVNGKCTCGGEDMAEMQTCECNSLGFCSPTFKYDMK